jgi:hypothetical protein
MREVLEISSGSEPEVGELVEDNRRFLEEVDEVLKSLMSRSTDEYFERPDGNERAKKRRGGEVSTSAARGTLSEVPQDVPVGRWRLDEGVWVEEPGRSMTTAEIQKMRKDWIIPSTVMLRPLAEGELATRPPKGWVCVHEHMFKHGFTLPLPGWVQYMLCALRLAPGQIGPNAWRQLLGMYTLWHLTGQG